MDLAHGVPYVMKHKKHPVSGVPLELKDLIQLKWHKNADGEYECPVLNKTFTDSTRICAIKTTGNVYCTDAVDELCVKAKNWKDLLTDEPFKRSDVITLQDPLNLKSRTLDNFDHVKRGVDVKALRVATAGEDGGNINTNQVSEDMRRVLDTLGSDEAKVIGARGGSSAMEAAQVALDLAKKKEKEANEKKGIENKPDPTDNSHLLRAPEYIAPADLVKFKPGASTWDTSIGGKLDIRPEKEKAKRLAEMAPYLVPLKTKVNEMRTTGHSAMGFTSTTMEAYTKNHRAEEIVWYNPTKKGYIRLHTNFGDLNIELHCDKAPRTCENFITLAEKGYYDGVKFHRSIKHFMLQGGDPTGTGRGGHCIWGETFADELRNNHYKHDDRGVLSMANSGPNTNGSQFFITYKPAPHLNGKHTVFGRVVGGMETLTKIEQVETDSSDRPLKTIKINSCTIFTNPYAEMREEEVKKEEEEEAAKVKAEEMRSGTGQGKRGAWWSDPAAALGASKDSSTAQASSRVVGKYVAAKEEMSAPPAAEPSSKKVKTSAWSFDSW
jgi:peptidyl-prolyl cis-trans isomerase-like protein 2